VYLCYFGYKQFSIHAEGARLRALPIQEKAELIGKGMTRGEVQWLLGKPQGYISWYHWDGEYALVWRQGRDAIVVRFYPYYLVTYAVFVPDAPKSFGGEKAPPD
jgi:hypothetical protein